MTGGDARTGLYVHIPFCEAKCTYCHFAIDPRRPDEARQERYLRAVLAELIGTEPADADTLYLGGGTPSLLAGGRPCSPASAGVAESTSPASASDTAPTPWTRTSTAPPSATLSTPASWRSRTAGCA